MSSQPPGTPRPLWRVISLPMIVAVGIFAIATILTTPGAAVALPMPQPMIGAGSLFSFAGDRPTNLGVSNGLLAPCPTSPNCVSSQSKDSKHQIDPLQFNHQPAEALEALKSIIQQLPRTRIVSETDNYLYVEFASALMGFVDDVEFYVDPTENVIQVRSASRLGESDLGVNRKRIEAIRKQLTGLNLVSGS